MKKRLVTRYEIVLLVVAVAALLMLNAIMASQKAIGSAEVKFTDASAKGLAIVPASCPSYPHYGGDCTGQVEVPTPPGQCTPQNICLGGANVINSCTGAVVQVCQWGCVNGGCLPPPPSYTQFTATFADSGGGTPTTFTATGHLQAKPLLVRSGTPARLYWSVSNAASCTVTGTNGDSFSGASSPSSGQVTGALLSQTTYTLLCHSLPKVSPATVTESVQVNIAPVFQEL
ncbi:MAG TPA: hypothetical protein VHD38_00115 [Candidatus Paceibacterota bacterium]|jgi:hypothetical protein|nr:hypothetical protein [Candidatus Paceibacterota bacterium]